MSSGLALIVGLGNPGPEYERTRHNVGFRVVDVLASRFGETIKPVRGVNAVGAEVRDGDRRLILVEPHTFMNLSGDPVREIARYHKVPPDQIVVVHDDLDLAFGAIRVKQGGGDGGHNGLKDITRALGTPNYPRVRIGIGRPHGRMQPVDYVLQAFSKKEEEEIGIVVEEAADAALAIPRDGIDVVQNRVHGGDASAAKPKTPAELKVRLQATIDAPVRAVWAAWTDEAVARAWLAPDARIEPIEGGAYEASIDGLPGGGGEVLALTEPSYASLSWGVPEGEPLRVAVSLRAAGRNRTRLNVTVGEFGDRGPIAEDCARALEAALGRLQRYLTEGSGPAG